MRVNLELVYTLASGGITPIARGATSLCMKYPYIRMTQDLMSTKLPQGGPINLRC